ncbi:MAG TPA: macro domain-containing protein [Anaerolineaceae bacterium]|nr:macro domain-containing protein [Anaerolineaceae bacterium]
MNRVVRRMDLPGGQTLEIVQGDLTEEKVGAIVNAANEHLAHGGGVAGIISRRGGRAIQEESDAWVRQHGPVSHREPAYTSAGNLPCRYVIHAVGPVWGSGDEDQKLADAVRGSLELAEELELDAIALPAISTGIFGFPKERAARVILATIFNTAISSPFSHLRQVRVVLYDDATTALFSETLDRLESHPTD